MPAPQQKKTKIGEWNLRIAFIVAWVLSRRGRGHWRSNPSRLRPHQLSVDVSAVVQLPDLERESRLRHASIIPLCGFLFQFFFRLEVFYLPLGSKLALQALCSAIENRLPLLQSGFGMVLHPSASGSVLLQVLRSVEPRETTTDAALLRGIVIRS
ncbi:MAG: hypothetical protein B7Z80_08660, partial [Rhodospirillales bacterium 20-64-7]